MAPVRARAVRPRRHALRPHLLRASALRAIRATHPELRRSSLSDLASRYQALLDSVHPRVMRGELTLAEARRQRVQGLFEYCGSIPGTRELAEANRERIRAYQDPRQAVPGAAALPRAIRRRARTGIVTNNSVSERREKLRVTGLTGLVNFLVTSKEGGRMKPAREIFEAALRAGAARGTRR